MARRGIGLLIVALLHGALIYGLTVSTALRERPRPLQTLLVSLVKEEPPPVPPPPPPPPKTPVPPPPKAPPAPPLPKPPPVVRPRPEPPHNALTADPSSIPQPTPPGPVAVPPSPVPPVLNAAPVLPVLNAVHVPPVIDAANSCDRPTYPAAAKRLGQTGTVILTFLIGVDGLVLEGKVEESSGSPRLDEAALDALKLCRFKPGTINGQPEQAWAELRYLWTLQ